MLYLQTKKKEKPIVKTFGFDKEVFSLSAVESKYLFSALVLMKGHAYVIHGDGTTVYLGPLSFTAGVLGTGEDGVTLYGGTREGLIREMERTPQGKCSYEALG